MDHRLRAFGCRCLNNGQVELVVAEALQGVVGFDELNEKGVWAALSSRPAVQVTQQGRLMGSAKKDLWITTIELAGNRCQANEGTRVGMTAHSVVSLPH